MVTSTDSVSPPGVQHARVNGVDLPYLDQGHGVPVVFVHGVPGDHRLWEGQREAVAERYRFIAPTLRYFGTGPWPDDGAAFSMATDAGDLAAFVRQLRGGPAHVVGWSYGGAIGILLAVHHPEWVKSLFLFEPGLATFVTDPADAQLAGEDRKEMRAPPPPPITCAQLGQITVPVAIAMGELARPFYRIAADTAHRCIPGSRLVVIRGEGHLTPVEHALVFNEVLLGFLKTL